MEENLDKGSQPAAKYILAGIAIITVIAVGAILTKMGSSREEATLGIESTSVSNASPTSSVKGVEDSGALDTGTSAQEVEIIEVEAGAYYFKPNIITVKAGQKVKIVMTSKDMMHDFNVDELGIKIPVTTSGNTAMVEFTADKAGVFEYYCSVGQHRQLGQVGKLIVE